MRKLPKCVAMMALGMAATAALPTSQLWAQDRDRSSDRDRGSDRDRDTDRDRDREGRLTEDLLVAEDLPREVRQAIEQEARGTNHFIDRRERNEGVRYTVHFTTRDNKRMVMRLDERGRVLDEPRLAREQMAPNLQEEHERDEADRSVRYRSIREEDVPDRVLQAMQKFRQGTHDSFFREQIRNGKTFYSVHYTTPDGERMWVRVAENGQVAEGPHINIGQDVGLNFAGRDTRDDREARRDDRREARQDRRDDRRDDRQDRRDARRGDQVRRVEMTAADLPADIRRAVEQETAGGTDHRFIRESDGDDVTYFVEYTMNGQRANLRVDDRGRVLGETEVAGGTRTRETRREELTAAELPADIRRAIEQETAGGTGHTFIRESRGGEVTYFVEYTMNGQRANLRVDDRGRVLGETEVAGAAQSAQMRREELTAGDLPTEVRRTVEQETAGGTGHRFIRETEGGRVSYFVEYTKAGQQANLRVDERGKVLGETEVAGTTPRTAPLTPQDADAELAAAGVASAHQVVSATDLPAGVRQAVEQQTQSGSQHLFQRHTQEGRVLYTVHYATADGDYNVVVLDERGQVLVQPRASQWLEGKRGVKFEVVSAADLPAEVRQTVERQAQGASEHLFVRRIRPDGGEPTYLVQFTNAKGRRMQMEVNANGKVRDEVSAARENPFRMAGRQDDREERRSERRSERQ